MGGTESKAYLKSQIEELVHRPIIAEDHAFWRVIFTTPLTSSEMVSCGLFASDMIAQLYAQPLSLGTLLFKCIEQLYSFLNEASSSKSRTTSVNNSLLILSKVIPLVIQYSGPIEDSEQGGDSIGSSRGSGSGSGNMYHFVENFFWFNRIVIPPHAQEHRYLEIGGTTLCRPLGQLLMQTLLDLAFCPGFTILPPLKEMSNTIPECPYLDPRLLWVSGCPVIPNPHLHPSHSASASSADPAQYAVSIDPKFERNRIDVLSCLLSCLTGTMLEKDPLTANRFLECIIAEPNCRNVTLMYSLLNTVLNCSYSVCSTVSSRKPTTYPPLMKLCLHVLLATLDYNRFIVVKGSSLNSPEKRLSAGSSLGNSESSLEAMIPLQRSSDKFTSEPSANQWHVLPKPSDIRQAFWYVFSQHIKGECDIRYLIQGIVAVLHRPVVNAIPYLLGNESYDECVDEMLLLLWKLIDVNQNFRSMICSFKLFDITNLLIPLLFYICDVKNTNPGTTNNSTTRRYRLQCSIILLLMLSSERKFAIIMNKSCAGRTVPVPDLPLFTGSHFDLLVIVSHYCIMARASSHVWDAVMFEGLLAVLYNLAPFCQALSMTAATKLVNLFLHFTSRKTVALATKNPSSSPSNATHTKHSHGSTTSKELVKLVALILEVMSRLMASGTNVSTSSQSSGSSATTPTQVGTIPAMVYAIALQKKHFERFAMSDFSALVEVELHVLGSLWNTVSPQVLQQVVPQLESFCESRSKQNADITEADILSFVAQITKDLPSIVLALFRAESNQCCDRPAEGTTGGSEEEGTSRSRSRSRSRPMIMCPAVTTPPIKFECGVYTHQWIVTWTWKLIYLTHLKSVAMLMK